MNFQLIVYLNQQASSFTYELDNSYIVGRDKNCGIRILSNILSREHCTLIYMPKSKLEVRRYYILRDGIFGGEHSRNGTWLNGTRIKEVMKLKHQDIISFGGKYPQASFWELELENEPCINGTFPFDYQEE